MPAATTPQPSSDPGSGPPELERIGDRDLGQWPTRAGQHLVAAIARVVIVLGRVWRWSLANLALVLTTVIGGAIVLGATVLSAQLGVDHAEATTIGFPSMDLCVLFSIDPALVARFNEATRVLATKVGLTWEWRRSRDRMYYTVRRAGA